jgi:hypothetical protein
LGIILLRDLRVPKLLPVHCLVINAVETASPSSQLAEQKCNKKKRFKDQWLIPALS